MRWLIFPTFLMAACSQEANHLGDPLLLPFNAASTVIGNAAYEKRRGQVEVVVKSNYEEIKRDIRAGQGPALTKAFDTAGVPAADRPFRVIQLQSDLGLYQTSPSALVTAFMVYGS